MTADALAVDEVPEISGEVVDLHTGEVAASALPENAQPDTQESSRALLAVARRALAEADSLPVLASIAHKGEVLRVAARKAKLSQDACLDWGEFSLDAQREAGRMLATMERARPGDNQWSGHDEPTARPTLRELGVESNDAKRWQAVASLPDEDYEEYKRKARAKGEITRAGAIKLAKQAHVSEANAGPIILPPGKFSTLVMDPPWRYGNTATRAAAQDHYDTLSIAQLCGEESLPDGTNFRNDAVLPKVADRAHLYMWTTAGHLPESFKVMEALGFTYKTYLVWVKPQMGMGNYFRVSTELVVFGVHGEMRTQDMGLMNYFTVPRGKHSSKPSVFYDLVERASPGPYLEFFARCDAANQLPGTCQCSRCLRGWEVWGNQA